MRTILGSILLFSVGPGAAKKLVDLAAENKIAKKNWLRFPEASFNF
jgi:hypothetical protein